MSIFDVLAPMAGIVRQLTHALGIEWVDGTVSSDGSKIDFNTGANNFNTGSAAADPQKLALIWANLDHPSLQSTAIIDIETGAGATVVGQGLQAAGAYRLDMSPVIPPDNRPAGIEPVSVKVGIFASRPQYSTGGDDTQWVTENLTGAGSFTASFSPALSDVNGDPVATVTVLGGGLGVGTPLQYSGGVLASGEWGISGTTISTFGADGITDIQLHALGEITITS
jgi:hypothetical protein